MIEYIFGFDKALYNEETGEAVFDMKRTGELIRCKDCKHWTQSMGKMKGYGLGKCDFHDADLVTCNGFCYWAERRSE